MRAFLHWALAVVLDHAAPEDRLAFVVGSLQLEPCIVGVHGATGEKWQFSLCALRHQRALYLRAEATGLHAIERRGTGDASVVAEAIWTRLFPNRKCRLNIDCEATTALACTASGEIAKIIDAQNAVLQEIFSEIELIGIFIGGWNRSIRTRKPMRVHEAVLVAKVVRSLQRHVTVAHCCEAFG